MSAMTQLDKKAKRTIMRILHTDMDTVSEPRLTEMRVDVVSTPATHSLIAQTRVLQTADALLELVTAKCPNYPRALVEEHIKGGLSAWSAPKGPSVTAIKEK